MTGHKLATSCPAQAVGAPTGGVLDGDGGGTAGPSRAGGWAARANGSQSREIPPQSTSTTMSVESTSSRVTPPYRSAQTPITTKGTGPSDRDSHATLQPLNPLFTPHSTIHYIS